MIYCVEDDAEIRNLILYALRGAGFEVKGFPSAKEFWSAMEENTPELIILDVMMPEEDGIHVLTELKKDHATRSIPVIMETAKGCEYDKVTGLDLGADDYLVKPFGILEMISRVKAVLRRSVTPTTASILKYGDLALDEHRHAVTINGEPLVLTLKEYELLRFFIRNTEMVFTRDQLLDKIWGLDYVGESRTVDVHIGTLRTKLKEYGERIETVRGVGYKMVNYDEKKDI